MNQNLTILIHIFLRSYSLCCFLPITYRNNGILQRWLIAIILTVLGWLYVPMDSVNTSLKSFFLEIVFGSLIAIPYLLAIEVTLFVADFLDSSRGQQLVGVQDPLSLDIVSNLGQLMKNTLVVILIAMNVVISGLELFLRLFIIFPVGSFTFNQFISFTPNIMEYVINYLSNVVCFLLIFSFLLFLIDWMCSLISKYFPVFNSTHEGFIIKSLVLFLLFITLVRDNELTPSLILLVRPFPFIEEVL